MGCGAGDIKDKCRTYDGDADKRLRKKLEKSGKFDESFKTPVRIEKINVEVMGRWVSERLAELLGFEDDVLSDLVMNMLAQTRDAKTGQDRRVDPQQLQVQLTGFLNKQAQPFVAELWKLLLDAQDAPHGIPRAFVERKKAELVKRRAEGDDSAAAAFPSATTGAAAGAAMNRAGAESGARTRGCVREAAQRSGARLRRPGAHAAATEEAPPGELNQNGPASAEQALGKPGCRCGQAPRRVAEHRATTTMKREDGEGGGSLNLAS